VKMQKKTFVAVGREGKRTSVTIRKSQLTQKIGKLMRLHGSEGTVSLVTVTLEKAGRSRDLLMALKKFKAPMQPVEEQFKILNDLKTIPGICSHVPPTVKLLEQKSGRPRLLLTDLTASGKYLLQEPNLFNPAVSKKMQELNGLLAMNGFGFGLSLDAYAMQVEAATGSFVKLWIVDAGQISRLKR